MRDFQDAFLHGPPPLGPGAPAEARLEASIAELIHLQVDHLQAALAAASVPAGELSPAYPTLLMHSANLIAEINPPVDAWIVAGYLLSAFAPRVLQRMQKQGEIDVPTLQRGAVQLQL